MPGSSPSPSSYTVEVATRFLPARFAWYRAASAAASSASGVAYVGNSAIPKLAVTLIGSPAGVRHFELRDRSPHRVRRPPRVREPRAGKDDHELLTAEPHRQVGLAHRPGERGRDRP